VKAKKKVKENHPEQVRQPNQAIFVQSFSPANTQAAFPSLEPPQAYEYSAAPAYAFCGNSAPVAPYAQFMPLYAHQGEYQDYP